MAYQINWKYKRDIKSPKDIQFFIDVIRTHNPKVLAIDTETTGLHIIRDKPFLLSFGFYTEDLVGYTFTYDLERGFDNHNMMRILYKACARMEKVIMHNAKFDLHMLTNIGYPYPHKNITDSQIFIRLAHDAVSQRFSGPPLGLKAYAVKYIDPKANALEKELKAEILSIHRENNKKLKQRLAEIPLPDKYKINSKNKSWSVGVIDAFLKDSINEISDLPQDVQKAWQDWKTYDYIEPSYNHLNRETVTKYAHYDIIFTLEIYHSTKDIIYERKQEEILKLEESLILPLYRMERVGFKFNKAYAYETKQKMRNYIIKKRNQLYQLAGEKVSVAQHQRLVEIFNKKYNIAIESCNDQVLNEIIKKNISEEATQFAKIIKEIRTLEKWYSTYILKWIEEEHEGRIYTQINQSGAVSGRVSSDFQQFPRDGIKDDQGNNLFIPRRLIQVSGEDYPVIAYFDYSQIELRFQALYTIFISKGDTNLCRAYMPFKCHTYQNGKRIDFDYDNPDHLKTFTNYTWYLNEDPKTKWHPVDLHSTTAKLAFNVDESHPDFKHLRSMGKTANFACNYGATHKTLYKNGYDWDTAVKLYEGYKKAFPKIQEYRAYVQQFLYQYPYIENLFGRRYYNTDVHRGCNYLIQGSAADFLKMKIIEVTTFLEKHNYKSRFQMNIHDELSFEIHKDEMHLLPKIKQIMEHLPGTKIPIVVDVEITRTTWDEKEEYNV